MYPHFVFIEYWFTSRVCGTDYGGHCVAASLLRRVWIEIPSRKARDQLGSSSERVRRSRHRKL